MASSYKYLSDHDRVVMSNNLDADVLSEQDYSAIAPEKKWKTDINSPYYFRQYASGSADDTFATSKRVFDITFGRSSIAGYDTPPTPGELAYHKAKQAIYNQLAKVLLGYNQDGSIKKFNLDPDSGNEDKVLHNAYFLNLCRSQFVDRVKVGTFSLKINVGVLPANDNYIYLKDIDGSGNSSIRTCESGQYGLLYYSVGDPAASVDNNANIVHGLVFYEAGIVVISPYIFADYESVNTNPKETNDHLTENVMGLLDGYILNDYRISGDISDLILASLEDLGVNEVTKENYLFDMLADRVEELTYQSTTELNSTIYFCRAYNHEFNYSSNPTYLQDSEIIVKGGDPDAQPRAYITSVGLYSDDNQLLAVAKLSEPILKTPENELIARVRIDF